MNSYNRHQALKGNRLLTLITFLLAVAVVAVLIYLYRKPFAFESPSSSAAAVLKSSQPLVKSSSAAQPAVSSQNESSSEVKTLSGTVFIGDSFTQSLEDYEKPDQASVFCSDEMTASSAVSKKFAFGSGKQSITDAAASKNPEKIFILLGSNDIANGYSSDKFISYYGQLVSNLKSKVPGVKIYVQSIFPVTDNYESKKHSGSSVTNKKIDSFNAALQSMCKSLGADYVDVSSVLKGTDGTLPSSGSSDGLHLTKSYCQKWYDYIKKIE